MKNICIFINTLLSGGAEKQSVFLANTLCKKYNVIFVVLKGDQVEEKFLALLDTDNINLYRLKGGRISNIFEFIKIIRLENVEISFSYLAGGNFLNAISGILTGVKYRIGGIRNAELSPKKLPFERFFHNKLLTKTISNSFSAVNGLSKLGFKRNKFHVIHNAFYLEQPQITREKKATINILSVARFVPQKDYLSAIKAIALLKEKIYNSEFDFKYWLIGYGELEPQIRTWVTEYNLMDKVEIIIKPDNLNEYYKKADIFLTTSLFEGLSNSVMEAMSFSLPVVATPAGDMKYLVKDGENGFICEIKNSEQIAVKLEILIKNAKLRNHMGGRSYHLISNNFTMEKFKNEYISFIESL